MKNKIDIAIWMVTYNHQDYIEQAVESVMIQKTDFSYKLFIGEDYSTDKTREICIALKNKYQNKIELILQEKNIGPNKNARQVYKACFDSDSKYIALCEGDDYWTDPLKLQKQIDFLETNSDYAICFHDAIESHIDKEKDFNYCSALTKETYELKDLFYRNFIPTCSAIFVNNITNYPNWLYELGVGDWPLHLLNAQYGKIKYLNEVMGVHRVHDKGIWSLNKQIDNIKILVQVYNDLGVKFKPAKEFNKEFREGKANMLYQLAREHKRSKKVLTSFFYLVKSLILNPTKSIWNIKQYYHFIK